MKDMELVRFVAGMVLFAARNFVFPRNIKEKDYEIQIHLPLPWHHRNDVFTESPAIASRGPTRDPSHLDGLWTHRNRYRAQNRGYAHLLRSVQHPLPLLS